MSENKFLWCNVSLWLAVKGLKEHPKDARMRQIHSALSYSNAECADWEYAPIFHGKRNYVEHFLNLQAFRRGEKQSSFNSQASDLRWGCSPSSASCSKSSRAKRGILITSWIPRRRLFGMTEYSTVSTLSPQPAQRTPKAIDQRCSCRDYFLKAFLRRLCDAV